MGIAKEKNKARRTKQHQRYRYNEQIDNYLMENNLFKTTGYGSDPNEGGETTPSTHKEKKRVKKEHEQYLADEFGYDY